MRSQCEELHLQHLKQLGDESEVEKFLERVSQHPKSEPKSRTPNFDRIYRDF